MSAGARKRPGGPSGAGEPTAAHRWFSIGTGIAFVTLGVLCVCAARSAWFFVDDFISIAQARADLDWASTFLPLQIRVTYPYRPLECLYFRACFLMFGDASSFGYILTSLLVHGLAAALVFRLATQLEFATPAAVTAAFLYFSGAPTFTQLFWPSVFHYLGAVFFSLLALSLLLDATRSGRLWMYVTSWVAVVLALLCNESSVTFPAVLLLACLHTRDFRVSRATAIEAVARVAPYAAVLAAYLFVTTRVITRVSVIGHFTPHVGWHILHNYPQLFRMLTGNGVVPILAALLLVATLLMLSLRVERQRRTAVAGRLLRLDAFCLAWMIVVLVPFAAMQSVAPRYAIPILAPAVLLVASWVDALWLVSGRDSKRWIEIGLLCAFWLCIPYGDISGMLRHPPGADSRRVVELLREQHANLPSGSKLVIFYTNPSDAVTFKDGVLFGGSLLGMAYPGAWINLDFRGPGAEPRGGSGRNCPECVYFKLLPGGLEIEPAKAGTGGIR